MPGCIGGSRNNLGPVIAQSIMASEATKINRLATGLSAFCLEALCFLLLFGLAVTAGCRRAPKDCVEISWATNQHHTRFDAIRHFERENPGIRVQIRPISEPRQFFLQCLFGDAPDVITFFQVGAFQTFACNDLLRCLNPEDYRPWPFYAGQKDYCFRRGDNALMALPQVAYPYLLYYNKGLVPSNKARAVKTWQDLLALIRSMPPMENSRGKHVFGLDIQSGQIWFTTWYWQRKGRLFDANTGRLVLDQAAAVDVLDAMHKWRSIKGLLPRPQDRLSLPSKGASQGVLGSLFLQGRAVFYWSGSWKICDFANQSQVDWGVLPLPAGPQNDLTILGGNSFGVSARSKYPVEAERLVKYLASLPAQKRHIAHQIYMPSRPACPVPEKYQVLKGQIARARTLEYSPRFNQALLEEIFKQVLDAHRLRQLTSTQAAADLYKALETGAVVVER